METTGDSLWQFADRCLSESFFQLLSHIEKLRTLVIDNLNANNVFYKKKIEEQEQTLQERNELIISQRQQVFWAVNRCCFSLSSVGYQINVFLF